MISADYVGCLQVKLGRRSVRLEIRSTGLRLLHPPTASYWLPQRTMARSGSPPTLRGVGQCNSKLAVKRRGSLLPVRTTALDWQLLPMTGMCGSVERVQLYSTLYYALTSASSGGADSEGGGDPRGGGAHTEGSERGDPMDGGGGGSRDPKEQVVPRTQCAVCSVQWCSGAVVQCAVCSLQFAVCSMQCAVCSVVCAVCSGAVVQCAVSSA